MDTATVVSNILTGVATGVITGFAAAFFGYRSAFKQFKVQRGFERRLDWNEKTTQAVFEFLHVCEAVVFAVKNEKLDVMDDAMKSVDATLKDFRKTVNNSLLYADRTLYLQLKEVGKKLVEITNTKSDQLGKNDDPARRYQAHAKLLDDTLYELAKPIREMIGLDALSRSDFDE